MLSGTILFDPDLDEYVPLLPAARFPAELDKLPYSDSESEVSVDSTFPCDADGDLQHLPSGDKHNWLFSLINWDQIFENAASFLNINFTDYDYDRYGKATKSSHTHKSAAVNNTSSTFNTSSVDTFNYFLSSLTNNRINMKIHKDATDLTAATTDDTNYSLSIYEIIYDRVAKSRLYSLSTIMDECYPSLNVGSVHRILAEIVSFELAPNTIRHMLYTSIINEYEKQCRPTMYKTLILVCNWVTYIAFFAVHIMWLQFVWMDFLHHFKWNDDDETPDGGDLSDADGLGGVDDIEKAGPWSGQFVDEPDPPGSHSDQALNSHLAKALIPKNATPFTIINTIGQWTYFQWTSAALFVFIAVYMFSLYYIARRVDAFGDFLKKLQLTQLLKLGKDSKVPAEDMTFTYGTGGNTDILLQYASTTQNEAGVVVVEDSNDDLDELEVPQDAHEARWGLDSDRDDTQNETENDSIFEESDLNEEAVWNYNHSSLPLPVKHVQTELTHEYTGMRMDYLSKKLVNEIEGIYYTREHLILYTVISLVKMLLIFLYLSCLVMFFVIPSAQYWYLWTLMVDLFAFYVFAKAANQLFCRKRNALLVARERHSRYVTEDGDVGIIDNDGIFKHEWIVAMVNIVSMTGLLILTTLIISMYMTNYDEFVSARMNYLQILAAIEIVWFASQFVLWKLSFYGTIFYLLLLIPSILFGSAAFYALYEYYILSLVHTFLAVIFACGEFHLVGPHDDDTTLDPSDWSVLGVLALLAKLFKFRMPQQV